MAGYIGSKTSVAQVDGYTRTEADSEFVSDPNGAVTVAASGNVGISTAAPQAVLDLGVGTGGRGLCWSNSASATYSNIWSSYSGARTTIGNGLKGSTSVSSGFESSVSSVFAKSAMSVGTGSVRFYTDNVSLYAVGTAVTPTERMRIDSSGRVTMPYQPAFDVSYSGSAYTTLGTVVFNAVYTNVGGHYNTSNGRFTAPVSGSYIFYTSLIKGNTPTAVSRRRFDKNGSEANNGRHLRLDLDQPYGDNGVMQALIYLNVNDYVTVNQYAGSSYGTNQYDYFGGYLIG